MNKTMYNIDEASKKIQDGEMLLLAGDEELLKSLPAGKWIGGTIPYFMTETGGLSTKDKINLISLPKYIEEINIVAYDDKSIGNINIDAYENGFSVIIIPASTKTHMSFALNAPSYEGFVTKPVVGWISGVLLDDLNKKTPKVFNGSDKSVIEDGAIVMHIKLPSDKLAEINIINIFEQGNGDSIKFLDDSFVIKNVLINDKEVNFAEYLLDNNCNIKFPLVANYAGAMINISFQNIDEAQKEVYLYAPVFKDVEYKLAKPVGEYIKEFTCQITDLDVDKIFFSCNCILNYLYSELEGKVTNGFTGPITFGEVAYQLLNQTMVYVTIK